MPGWPACNLMQWPKIDCIVTFCICDFFGLSDRLQFRSYKADFPTAAGRTTRRSSQPQLTRTASWRTSTTLSRRFHTTSNRRWENCSVADLQKEPFFDQLTNILQLWFWTYWWAFVYNVTDAGICSFHGSRPITWRLTIVNLFVHVLYCAYGHWFTLNEYQVNEQRVASEWSAEKEEWEKANGNSRVQSLLQIMAQAQEYSQKLQTATPLPATHGQEV